MYTAYFPIIPCILLSLFLQGERIVKRKIHFISNQPFAASDQQSVSGVSYQEQAYDGDGAYVPAQETPDAP